jgi:hypothetical protein
MNLKKREKKAIDLSVPGRAVQAAAVRTVVREILITERPEWEIPRSGYR